jgi:hypothetical protein
LIVGSIQVTRRCHNGGKVGLMLFCPNGKPLETITLSPSRDRPSVSDNQIRAVVLYYGLHEYRSANELCAACAKEQERVVHGHLPALSHSLPALGGHWDAISCVG